VNLICEGEKVRKWSRKEEGEMGTNGEVEVPRPLSSFFVGKNDVPRSFIAGEPDRLLVVIRSVEGGRRKVEEKKRTA